MMTRVQAWGLSSMSAEIHVHVAVSYIIIITIIIIREKCPSVLSQLALQYDRSPLRHGRSPKKSYIFSVTKIETIVAVLRKRLRL